MRYLEILEQEEITGIILSQTVTINVNNSLIFKYIHIKLSILASTT